MPTNRSTHTVVNNQLLVQVTRSLGLAVAALALLVTTGCRSDDGTTTNIEFLQPSEWFAGDSDEPHEPEHSVSGETRGKITVPPVPPPIEGASSSPSPSSPPAAPAASGDSYYGVRRTGSRNVLGGLSLGGDAQEPKLQPVPGSYE